LLSLLFNFAVKYTIRKNKEIKEGLELNRMYQLLVCTDDVNLQNKNISALKTETIC